ncbi:MAG: ABC transporter permease [Proteobacteria bacterium]|nr:ABC transporter permease [Pseudomonadota bacterium]
MPQDAATATASIITVDGVPLKTQLNRANRRRRIRAVLLVVPLFIFILISFLIPIGDMLFRSVDNPVVAGLIPETLAELDKWNGKELPDERTFETMAKELGLLQIDRKLGKLGSRLNFERGGMRSLITKTGRKLKKIKQGPYKEALIKIDKRWGDRDSWAAINLVGLRYTGVNYLASVDLRLNADGDIVMQPEVRQIYTLLWMRTLWISLAVTVFCLLLGYPIAYLMATLPVRISNLLMILVLLPFWTSLLVRTTSWIVLLQAHGVINDLLVWVGIISEEGRIRMIYNWIGTLIAMTQILLPFMVLPLYSVMKTIPKTFTNAAQSMGATPAWAFYKVYVPQTMPGIGAGILLVFIISLGYYITPALVGGPRDQMISYFIAFHTNTSVNWGMAAALSVVLLFCVMIFFGIYNRFVGIEKMKLG